MASHIRHGVGRTALAISLLLASYPTEISGAQSGTGKSVAGAIERLKKRANTIRHRECDPEVKYEGMITVNLGKGPQQYRVRYAEGKFSRLCGKSPNKLDVYNAGGQLTMSFEDFNSDNIIGNRPQDKYTVVTGSRKKIYTSDEFIDERGTSYKGTGPAAQTAIGEARRILASEATPRYQTLMKAIEPKIQKRVEP